MSTHVPHHTVRHEAARISLQGVSKRFAGPSGQGAGHLVLDQVSLSLAAGEFVCLLGPSGCGKSTVLNLLSGFERADQGLVQLDGRPITGPGAERGMVFQQPLLLKWRNVLDNVLLPADILGLPRKAAVARAHELLEMVGLTGFADKFPYELSGGMQQRASIARALIHDPKLVLMDEPFGALDALTREKMNLEMLRIWAQSRKTFVVVTHSIQEAVFLGTHCAVMTAGPARMADFFAIDLPKTRKLQIKTTPQFGDYVTRIYELLGVE